MVKFSIYLNRLVFVMLLHVDILENCWMSGKQCRPDQVLLFVAFDMVLHVCSGLSIPYTIKHQWFKHLWDHGNLLETWIV